ncbi:hypothetical protein FRC07_014826 [Ceratobasidium sp. 392]|nr:hypothetical protein FRC07_014826 [Ceratobasidium sp. 392]
MEPGWVRPLVLAGKNLNANGEVKIVADSTHLYRYRIVNDTTMDLCPYLFYFHASKLSIALLSKPTPRLWPDGRPRYIKGCMLVGFGWSGAVPFVYCLGEDQRFGVGIIKLFVTTSPVNFGLLEQESPFEEGGRGNERKVNVRSRLASVQLWDTQSMVLVQRDTLPESKVPEPEPEPVPAPKPDSKVPLAPVPIAQPAKAQLEGVLNGRYGLWVVFPAALALSDPIVPQAFALIIGINTYPKVRRLAGAVPDGQAVASYLRSFFGVPSNHVIEIYNEDATRAGILQAFRNLCKDERIKEGDPIVIFYAGHGTELKAPEDWDTEGQKIQALVPYDVKESDNTKRFVEVIPDWTIGSLLEDLAEAKGNNITVILDCCHSASGTRVSEDSLVRLVDPKDLPPLSPDTDKEIRKPRVSVIPTGFARRGLRSHVLMAACKATETAQEPGGRGAFTVALLSILRRPGVEKLTYAELQDKIPYIPHPSMTRVQTSEGIIKLQAGSAQGVTMGALFDIFQHHWGHPASNPCLATLEVTNVQEFDSTLAGVNPISTTISDLVYARQSTADLVLDLGPNGRVTFDTRNELCNRHEIFRLPCTTTVNVQKLLAVLESAALWNWHIRRTNPEPHLSDHIRIEMLRVVQDLTRWNPDGRRPLIPAGKNLNANDVAEIVADPTHYYGYRLVNDTGHYSLNALPSFGQTDILLPHQGSTVIGYGSSGVTPFAYYLEEGQKFDVGIVKLFVTTSSAHFGMLEQESPFKGDGRASDRRVNVRSRLEQLELWDTQQMVLVQRRPSPVPEPESIASSTTSQSKGV